MACSVGFWTIRNMRSAFLWRLENVKGNKNLHSSAYHDPTRHAIGYLAELPPLFQYANRFLANTGHHSQISLDLVLFRELGIYKSHRDKANPGQELDRLC